MLWTCGHSLYGLLMASSMIFSSLVKEVVGREGGVMTERFALRSLEVCGVLLPQCDKGELRWPKIKYHPCCHALVDFVAMTPKMLDFQETSSCLMKPRELLAI